MTSKTKGVIVAAAAVVATTGVVGVAAAAGGGSFLPTLGSSQADTSNAANEARTGEVVQSEQNAEGRDGKSADASEAEQGSKDKLAGGADDAGKNDAGGSDSADAAKSLKGATGKGIDATTEGISSIIRPGTRLGSGDYALSPNKKYGIVQQSDGNLVYAEVGSGKPLWSSQTHKHPGAYTVFGRDGNLVVYDANDKPLFASATQDRGTALLVQNDANLVIYDDSQNGIWSSQEQAHVVYSGQKLFAGQSRVSLNGKYTLTQQSDGNLVLRDSSDSVVWDTRTNKFAAGGYSLMTSEGNLAVLDSAGKSWFTSATSSAGAYLRVNDDGEVLVADKNDNILWGSYRHMAALMPGQVLYEGQERKHPAGYRIVQQSDGNLVLFDGSGKAIWSTKTEGNPGARTIMQPEGNVVVYSQDNRPLWSTKTEGKKPGGMVVQDDGNLVLYDSSKNPIWASDTAR